MPFVEDPTVFLADFGVPVTSGSTSGLGILDSPGEYLIDEQVISTAYTLRAEASKFGSLIYGASVTVNSVAYAVIDNRLLDDGVFCLISLQKT
jgi:hypothetical protein